MEHLTKKEIIEFNKLALKSIKVKKADKHEILNEYTIGHMVAECKAIQGDPYDEATCLLKNLIQKHPFASGNRRTAFIATMGFLERNNLKLNVEDNEKQVRVLQGIRENYYTDKEIKEWLKTGKIREFVR